VSPDLSVARVFFRPQVDGGEVGVEETLEGLETAAPFIRRELGKVLRMRRIPELRFLHDTTLDSARRIEEVLKEVLPEAREAEPEEVEED
jgi:ribosome-binding factor A